MSIVLNDRGWKVRAFNGRRFRTKVFPVTPPSPAVSDIWSKYQEARANYFEALCQKNAAAVKYLNFVSSNHRLCKEARGVGVHGITLSIIEQGNQASCGFTVYMGDSGFQKRVMISESVPFSMAWKSSVDIWAKSNSIREKDRERVLRNSPGPEAFRELRRQLNAEGAKIQPDALRYVFSEKRAEISSGRSSMKPQNPSPSTPESSEIEDWFESQMKNLA